MVTPNSGVVIKNNGQNTTQVATAIASGNISLTCVSGQTYDLICRRSLPSTRFHFSKTYRKFLHLRDEIYNAK